MQRSFVLSAIALLALASIAPAAAQQAYTLTDLGPSGFGSDLDGVHFPGINASGQVSGTTTDSSGSSRAFRWTPTPSNRSIGTPVLLPLPSRATSSVGGPINSSGQVTGFAQGNNFEVGDVWQPDGTITSLGRGELAGDTLNDAGEVAGWSWGRSGQTPFLWVNGKTYNLSSQFPGFDVSAMNSNGEIVGDGASGAYLWTPAAPNGTSGASVPLPLSNAWAINDAGLIAGNTSDGQAALYDSTKGLTPLGVLPDDFYSTAFGLNKVGLVVGESYDNVTWTYHAFLWDSVQGMRDLNDTTQFTLDLQDGSMAAVEGWVVEEACAVNDAGQIVASASNPAGQERLVLLTPQP